MSREFTLPHEVVEKIALASLQDDREYLQKELDAHFKDGAWLHPDDVSNNRELIYCLDKIIHYYGGE
jgi:hypothetical protein